MVRYIKMSTNFLKSIALICMVIDHIGEFFPQAPVWFRYIGRVSAPLFFYCSAWGFYYTSNRKKYLIRLYLMGILMSVGNVISYCWGGRELSITNNIFTTLFLGCMLVSLFDRKNIKKEKWLLLFVIQQIAAFGLCVVFAELLEIPDFVDMYMCYYVYGALFGSVIFTEGSIWFVLFFVAIYFLKERKVGLSVFVLSFAVILELLIRRTYYMRGPASYIIPFNRFQWMMIFVLPFLWAYNGKKGKGMKWFYYLFYPLHIWLLYIVSLKIA